MARRFVAMIAVAAATMGMGLAQAGQGLNGFSVDADAPKPATAPTAVAKTPQGIECPLGIAQVKALDGQRFEFDGKSYAMRDLTKALRKANKPKRFDCVVIDGGSPSVDGVKRAVKDLSSAPVNHVEWSAARPSNPHGDH